MRENNMINHIGINSKFGKTKFSSQFLAICCYFEKIVCGSVGKTSINDKSWNQENNESM